ncbi:unnamed protein product [Rhodiola kirilowii]
MGKRSRRHMHWHGKNKLGCMWSWISLFDFGQSRGNQKLLSDKRRKEFSPSDSGAPKSKLKMLRDVEEIGQRPEGGIVGGEAITDANKLSVKNLIEEEMVTESTRKRNKISLSGSEFGGIVRRNQKKANMSSQIDIPDPIENSGSDDSGNDLYIEAIMQEIFNHIQQKSVSWSKQNQQGEPLHSEQKLSLLEERISEATKAIMHQKFLNGKHLTEARKVHYYNKYMDTLEMLDTNKEFFLKLSEDPNSSLMKKFSKMPTNNSIQKTPSNLKLSEERPSDLQYTFFRRKLSSTKGDKPNDKSKHSVQSNKIVILKPERTELPASATASSPIVRYNAASQFSLSEIRKKLRLAMQKDRQGTSSGDVASMSPFKNQKLRIGDKLFDKDNLGMCSPSRNHFFVEKIPRLSSGSKLADKVKNKNDVSAKQRVSSIYIEAKRHLSELLNNGDEDERRLSITCNPKTLEKLLSIPESSMSPYRIPSRESFDYRTTEGRFSTNAEAQPCNQKSQEIESVNQVDLDDLWSRSSEADLCPSDNNSANALEAPTSKSGMGKETHAKDTELVTTVCSLSNDQTSQGGMKAVEATDSLHQLADSLPVVICESTSSIVSSDDQNICTEEINQVEDCSANNEQDTREEYIAPYPSPLAHPYFSAINIDTDDLASPIDKSERPSPISVLEHVFSEDEVSPSDVTSHNGSVEPRRLRPICIQFDEDELSTTAHDAYIQGCVDNREMVFKYVEAVLPSTELCWEEIYMTSLISSQLLDGSLFDEAGRLFGQLPYDDRRLLFDCANQILNGMCQRYFGGCPLISFLKLNIRPVPKPENVIQEVWEGVEWHLLPPPYPQSLEQIVRKDLERDAAWMDLRLDLEGLSVEMEITILHELIEDAVLSCLVVLVK